MIGPTVVGKTEIARRLAKLAKAPFIKVEATKFTEVGYVGRDVDSIIRDLADIAVKLKREEKWKKLKALAEEAAEERIFRCFIAACSKYAQFEGEPGAEKAQESADAASFRKKFREGLLNDKEVEIEVSASSQIGVEIMAPPGMEEMSNQLQSLFKILPQIEKIKKT